jgi:hypothetical protein
MRVRGHSASEMFLQLQEEGCVKTMSKHTISNYVIIYALRLARHQSSTGSTATVYGIQQQLCAGHAGGRAVDRRRLRGASAAATRRRLSVVIGLIL